MLITKSGITTLALLALGAGVAVAGVPYPTRSTPAAVDEGRLADRAVSRPITVTIAMRLRDPAGAELMLQRVAIKGDPNYRRWLTPAEFAARFGPTDQTVASVQAALGAFNLTTQRTGATLMHVTGAPADLERAFGVTLHQFSVPATAGAAAYSFRAPVGEAILPAAIAPLVSGVFGLDTHPAFRPHLRRALRSAASAHVIPAAGAPKTPDAPGSWTVRDFDIYYNALPLQRAGFTGAGHTLGIVTLASFTQSDAYTYWHSVGLTVAQGRITEIPVDGGDGPPSDAAGSDETTLDVEQSGGIAPGAGVLVYEAPNTNQGFVDDFGQAVEDNKADSLSTSWGDWEWFFGPSGGPVTNPVKGGTSDQLRAFHALFIQAGLQGQSLFAASGDSGAYDVGGDVLPPDFTLPLSVDYPASDAAITAAGGTTLPGTQVYALPGGVLSVTIPGERVWSWDYLAPICGALNLDPINCGIFPVGSGGGVSFEFPLPAYQSGLKGVRTTAPDQVLIDEDVVPPKTIFVLPAGHAGRNVPDISFNADPQTGYVIGYTSSAPGSVYGDEQAGGTSFVAPQLNGVTQLLIGVAGKRLGLLNPLLYSANLSYTGRNLPIRVIRAGNNDFYDARNGYAPAAGLGVLNVDNLASAVK